MKRNVSKISRPQRAPIPDTRGTIISTNKVRKKQARPVMDETFSVHDGLNMFDTREHSVTLLAETSRRRACRRRIKGTDQHIVPQTDSEVKRQCLDLLSDESQAPATRIQRRGLASHTFLVQLKHETPR